MRLSLQHFIPEDTNLHVMTLRPNHLAQLQIKRKLGWHQVLWPVLQQFSFLYYYFQMTVASMLLASTYQEI